MTGFTLVAAAFSGIPTPSTDAKIWKVLIPRRSLLSPFQRAIETAKIPVRSLATGTLVVILSVAKIPSSRLIRLGGA